MRKSVFGAIRGVFFERQPQNWWKYSYFGPTDMKIEYLREYFDSPTTRTPLLKVVEMLFQARLSFALRLVML